MLRPYEPDDLEQVARIWQEVGWPEGETRSVRDMVGHLPGYVALVHGQVEAHACRRAGELRYEDGDLPASLIAAAAVSMVGRGQRVASRASARLVADAALEGAALSCLGIFDQGFYDRLGFGTGTYCRYVTLDPALLDVAPLTRAPIRLGPDDGPRMHAARLRRMRCHGAFSFPGPGATLGEVHRPGRAFGVGFEDADGRLTHHLWCAPRGMQGPHTVRWMSYESVEQAMELLSVIASWRDQVLGVRMQEPIGFRLDDVTRTPFRRWTSTRGGTFDSKPESYAWWQARILDLPACIGAVRIAGKPVRFQLQLTDPVAQYLPDDSAWRGIGGDWQIRLGPTSAATQGVDPSLPVLRASVGAFTRVWLGVAPASVIAGGDDLRADDGLIEVLDRRWRVPEPLIDWDM